MKTTKTKTPRSAGAATSNTRAGMCLGTEQICQGHESIDEQEWLTIDEACAHLRCSRATLYRLIGSGDLRPDGRVGRRWRFRVSSLDAFMSGVMMSGRDGMGRSAGLEDEHANQEKPAKIDARAGNSSRRSGTLHSARSVDRSKDRKKKEEGRSSDDVRGSRGSQGKAFGSRVRDQHTYEAAIHRLRRAMDGGQR